MKTEWSRAPRIYGPRHPRGRVLTALPVLLWEPSSLANPTLGKAVERALHARGISRGDVLAAYRRLWERVR